MEKLLSAIPPATFPDATMAVSRVCSRPPSWREFWTALWALLLRSEEIPLG